MSNLEDDYYFDEFEIPDEILVEDDKDDPEHFPKGYETETPLIDMQEVYSQNPAAYEKLENVDGYEFDTEECNSMLNLNKHLIRSLQELKNRTTAVLQKCERKLSLIETTLEKHTPSKQKVLICSAGMPYFKDKNFFCPPKNDDEILMASRGEIQVENLPKVSNWTSKERNTLLKAIRQEAITDVLQPRDENDSESDDISETSSSKATRHRRKKKQCLPNDFRDMVGPLGSREFDWLKISAAHFEHRHSPMDCCVMWNVFLHPDINKSRWTKSEDNELKAIARQYKFQNWEGIAKQLQTNRSAYQCFIRYNSTKKHPQISYATWNKKEDEKLLKLIEIFRIGDYVPWGDISRWMRNRTKQQIYYRWTYSLAPDLVKGRFSKAEDKILIDGVTKYGLNFSKISALLMPNRSVVQLNDHYKRLCMNNSKKSHVWSAKEDMKLMHFYERFGPDWSRISKAFKYKTRTQLRHRYKSLRKYNKSCVSVFGIQGEGSEFLEEDEEEEEEEEHEDSTDEDMKRIEDDLKESNRDFDDSVDKKLIEYFRMKRVPEKSNPVPTLYDVAELKSTTKKLYDILQLLNAKLEIPDDIDRLRLNNREKQLLLSLKEYIKLKNDNYTNQKIIENCGLHMFGSDEEKTHFIPPLPFNPQIRVRAFKMSKTKNIDYRKQTNKQNLILESPTIMENLDFVISYIGGEEQELQFQKFSRLLCACSTRKVKPDTVQKIYILPPKLLAEKHCTKMKSNNLANSSFDKIIEKDHRQRCIQKQTSYNLLEEPPYIPTVPYVETSIDNKETPMLEPTYATLSGFKILMYLKRIFDSKYDKSESPIESHHWPKEIQESYNLLKTRIEQLFKYSIGLSKTITPQVYETDIFTYDYVMKKRKSAKSSNPGCGKKLKAKRSQLN